MTTVTMIGVSRGNTILKNMPAFVQPSMVAASSSSYGTDLIKPWKRNIVSEAPKPWYAKMIPG